ncbi:MAG: D-alanyl-D-alanine carboxypeptidase [Syntrophomonas sp.]|uniref:D-alanyl-D-alanine carboxypeptidase family protein n=1 Tax=Syntrophomonas sp. TaxID=2053627 RepID=UPI00263425A0|nr:D-alanyl-D-alanine carboxypeptidase family protein [Syntrophomonas sp.]MDD2511106.1 D-alanyl-D-alanine carboxypeptidase [Syntrophomonas sp.]MDD4627254.1 D-alanyl-D-alanine carboxypeptidase [Syntrophomonas sp.]
MQSLFILLCLGVMTAPVFAAPYISSPYYCLMDGESGQVIISQNGDKARPAASTVKMMTAILAVEYAGMEEEATVSSNAARTPEYGIGLKTEQKIAVGELLKVALIRSSNDAAVVLAEHIAGDEGFFAHLMSKKAFVIGAFNSRFSNASGLPGGEQNSTSCDLAQIGRYAQSHPQIKELVATRESEFRHPSYGQPLRICNTNSLLGSYKGANGIKTGTANAAGKCLVASAVRDGRHLIAVVLKSSDRAGDCMRLLDYGFKNSYRQKIIDAATPFKELQVLNGEITPAKIYPARNLYLWVGEDSPNIEKRVKMNYELQAPLSRGQKVGSLEVYAEGRLVESMPLLCGDNVARRSNLLKRIIKDFILP